MRRGYLLSMRAVAARLGVSTATVRGLCERGELPRPGQQRHSHRARRGGSLPGQKRTAPGPQAGHALARSTRPEGITVTWERRGGGLYFYRSVRRGGRVVKEYGGGGPFGQLEAMAAEAERLERDERKRAEAEQRPASLGACGREAPLEELSERVSQLVSQPLTAAGYHRSGRRLCPPWSGPWSGRPALPERPIHRSADRAGQEHEAGRPTVNPAERRPS